jgi:hypothetical protein
VRDRGRVHLTAAIGMREGWRWHTNDDEGGLMVSVRLRGGAVTIAGAGAVVAVALGAVVAWAGMAFAKAAPRQAGPVLRWSSPRLVDDSAPFGMPVRLAGVSCLASGTCLAVGANGTVVTSTSTGNHVATVDGGAQLVDISCPAASLCVIAESNALLTSTDPTAARPTWRRAAVRLGGGGQYAGVTCVSATLCVAWGHSNSLEVTSNPVGEASGWQPIALSVPRQATGVLSVSCAPAATLCVATLAGDRSRLATTTNPSGGPTAWTVTSAAGLDNVDRIVCLSTSLCVGVSPVHVETSTNPAVGASSWTQAGVPGATSDTAADGIACASAAQCVVALSDGSVATSANPGSGALSYSVSGVLDPSGFDEGAYGTPLACPTTAACVIPDESGGLATVALGTPPTVTVAPAQAGVTAVTGLACPALNLCLGVDDAGTILRTTAPAGGTSGWQHLGQATVGDQLRAISCPTRHFCAAVGGGDRVVTSRSPATARRWHAIRLPFTWLDDGDPNAYTLSSISCPTAHLCVAGTNQPALMVSRNPSGGVRAWKRLAVGGFEDSFSSVTCPEASLCFAAHGTVSMSRTPTIARSWKRVSRDRFDSLSCPTAHFCLGGEDTGVIAFSTHPAGSSRPWKHVRLTSSALIAASCRSTSFCVVVDKRGDAFTSSDPTGPARAWRRTRLNVNQTGSGTAEDKQLAALACAPTRVCVTGTANGVLFSGRS